MYKIMVDKLDGTCKYYNNLSIVLSIWSNIINIKSKILYYTQKKIQCNAQTKKRVKWAT